MSKTVEVSIACQPRINVAQESERARAEAASTIVVTKRAAVNGLAFIIVPTSHEVFDSIWRDCRMLQFGPQAPGSKLPGEAQACRRSSRADVGEIADRCCDASNMQPAKAHQELRPGSTEVDDAAQHQRSHGVD